MPKRNTFQALFLTLAFLLQSVHMFSNGGFRSSTGGGKLITAPFAREACSILSEDLFVDLRGLTDDGYAVVRAEYQIQVDEDADSLLFVFVAASALPEGVSIMLDGRPYATRLAGDVTWDPIYRKPKVRTPWGAPSGWENEEFFKEDYVLCPIPRITAGRHQLVIEYRALTTYTRLYVSQSKTTIRSLSYALYPARDWKSFGRLNLRIAYPAGWDIETNLNLKREKGQIAQVFDSIPSDFLFVHTRYANQRATVWIWAYDVVAVGLLLAISLVVIRRIRRKPRWTQVLLLLALSLSICIAFMFQYLRKADFFEQFISREITFYSDRDYMILGTPFILVFTIIIMFVLQALDRHYLHWRRRDSTITQ